MKKSVIELLCENLIFAIVQLMIVFNDINIDLKPIDPIYFISLILSGLSIVMVILIFYVNSVILFIVFIKNSLLINAIYISIRNRNI